MSSCLMPIWGDVLTGLGIHRESKPRRSGLTCVLDKHLGIEGTKELISVAGPYVDVVKLTSLTSAFMTQMCCGARSVCCVMRISMSARAVHVPK